MSNKIDRFALSRTNLYQSKEPLRIDFRGILGEAVESGERAAESGRRREYKLLYHYKQDHYKQANVVMATQSRLDGYGLPPQTEPP